MAKKSKNDNNPITLVMQWLTYAFWGWFVIALFWLMYIVFGHFLGNESSDDSGVMVAYSVAGTLVLYVVAVTLDLIYRKREPANKSGFASAIMVIHAVIFALFGIGATITAIFLAINLVISTTPNNTAYETVMLYSMLITTLVYILLFTRTTAVHKVKRIASITTYSLLLVAGVFVVLAGVGPISTSINSKHDRMVSAAIDGLNTNVSSYTSRNNKLPATLNEAITNDNYIHANDSEVKYAVDNGLVKYVPDSMPSKQTEFGVTYYYKLCAKFDNDTTQKKSDYGQPVPITSPTSDSISSSPEFMEYQDTRRHVAGEQCYRYVVYGNTSSPEKNF